MTVVNKPKNHTNIILLICIFAALIVILALCYAIGAKYYETRFPRGTTINGQDVSNQSVETVKDQYRNGLESYTLTIQERNQVTEVLTADEVGMTYNLDDSIDELFSNYSGTSWLRHLFTHDDYEITLPTQFDEDAARQAIANLSCMDNTNAVQPENAQLVLDGANCYIQESSNGTLIDSELAASVIYTALSSLESTVDLDAAGCYLQPEITGDDPQLQQELAQINQYLNASITFDMEDGRIYTVDRNVIADWLTTDENGDYTIDETQAFEWVKTQLAYQTDTFGLTHTFTTTGGETISLKGGDYGWCIARQSTTDKLVEAIKNGEVTTMEPEYQYTAKSRGVNDIGGTYVEISIEQQHVWCYKDGVLVVESDCVTGNLAKGYDTPSGGVWAIDAKKSPAVLGTLDTMGYSSPVNFWMPFNSNVGMHDADGWRSQYGGTIYKTNGSHGCVNLPYSAAEIIYQTVEIGTAVVVY